MPSARFDGGKTLRPTSSEKKHTQLIFNLSFSVFLPRNTDELELRNWQASFEKNAPSRSVGNSQNSALLTDSYREQVVAAAAAEIPPTLVTKMKEGFRSGIRITCSRQAGSEGVRLERLGKQRNVISRCTRIHIHSHILTNLLT